MPASKQTPTAAKEDAQDPMLLAMEFYAQHLKAGDPVSFRACATKFGVNRETLRQQIAGRKTQKDAHSDMLWFTPEEAQILTKFLIKIAEHGFPESTQKGTSGCVSMSS